MTERPRIYTYDQVIKLMNEQERLWESVAQTEFPSCNSVQLAKIKLEAAVEWLYDEDTKGARAYDKYVMMKTLMDTEREA